MLDAILRKAGYRTGLYTSPYIQDFTERIQVNGECISGEALARITEHVRTLAEEMDDHPSHFELITAIAMVYFVEQKCDIVVLEVGMGGELDSTNVIDSPEAAVISNIGLEHTEYLGDTIEKIAATKGGIIKSGCNAVCYDGLPEATETIRKICLQKGVPLTSVDFSRLTPVSQSLDGQIFIWDKTEYFLSLLGPHQLHNAAAVLETIEVLRGHGFSVPAEAVKEGLRCVRWPARFEKICSKPLFILDGGHNPQGADALAECIRTLLPEKNIIFLIGILADKDYTNVLATLMPFTKEFICLTPPNDRALDAKDLAGYLTLRDIKAKACPDIGSGIRTSLDAAGPDDVIIAFGSLYLVGAIRTIFPEVYRDHSSLYSGLESAERTISDRL